jgi:ketosteroid isomerase-like protein
MKGALIMSETDGVRKASDQFYSALNRMAVGETDSMENIWQHQDSVSTMHPIGGRETGWEAVKGSFNGVAGVASGGKVELKDQLVRVVGDLAYEIGNEEGELTVSGKQIKIDQRVTNIYQKEGGSWKLVHHHADISPAMVEIISSLQPGS